MQFGALVRSGGVRQVLISLLLAVAVGITAGAAVSLLPFWAAFVALPTLAAGYAMLVDTRVGLAVSIGIATIIPFATLPFRAVVTPALLTLALLMLAGVWIIRLLVRPDERLVLTPLGLPLLGFLGITFFSFLLGSNASPDSRLLHNYFKFLTAVLFFFSIVNCVRNREQARFVLRCLIIGGAISAAVGLLIYIMPDDLALRLLVALGRVGYPDTGRVLRYVEDDTSGLERAIGLSVDRNSCGGMLAPIGALTATQLVVELGLLARRVLIGCSLLVGLVLFLTYSRAALGGLIVATMYVATLRYRRLWWAILATGGLAALLFIGLGIGEQFVERVVEGVQFRDQANQMRLAEFQNAVAIIQAYPFFGIGFGQAPELDLIAGVSSVYLAVAQRTGLIGLAAFLTLMIAFFVRSLGTLRATVAEGDDERAAWLVSLQAAIAAALAVGLLDHYFFNIEFSHMSALLWGSIALALTLEETATAES